MISYRSRIFILQGNPLVWKIESIVAFNIFWFFSRHYDKRRFSSTAFVFSTLYFIPNDQNTNSEKKCANVT